MSRLRRLGVAYLGALSLLQAGCPADPPPPPACTLAYLGDPAQPMQIELFYLPVGDGPSFGVKGGAAPQDLTACGPVDIVQPPQGTRVLFVGARANNLDPCNASLTTALRDPATNAIVGSPDIRSTVLVGIAGRPGWGETPASGDNEHGFANVGNMQVCPNFEGTRDIQQQPWLLEVDLKDRSGKKGQVLQRVFPRCALGDATCECTCQTGWTAMKCSGVDMWPQSPDAGACFPGKDGG